MRAGALTVRVEVLRHDDIISAAVAGPPWVRIARGLRWAWALHWRGGFGRLRRLGRRARAVAAYPVYGLIWAMLEGALVALLLAWIFGLGSWVVGLGVVAALLLSNWTDRRLFHLYLFDTWRLLRAMAKGRDEALRARDEAAVARVEAALADGADEVVVLGHSIGAIRAERIVAAVARRGHADGRLALVTLGPTFALLQVWAGHGAERLVADERVMQAAGIPWLEVVWRRDAIALPWIGAERPGRPLRLTRAGRVRWPGALRRRVPFRPMLRHLDYLLASEGGAFDLYRMLADPRPVAVQAMALRGEAE
ncbi:MAG: hypothetical protein AAGE18_11545 [Pseudomonadota bacterium]